MTNQQDKLQQVFTTDYLGNYDFILELLDLPIATQVSVTTRYKGRLDLLSYDYYNSSQYWAFIGLYNRIVDCIDFDNSTLNLPSLIDLNLLIQKYELQQ